MEQQSEREELTGDERQFLLTTAWMFVLHGQGARARVLCEALVEDDPRDGVAAVALAEQMIGEREATEALQVLRAAVVPERLSRVAAVLETRALTLLGRKAEARRRWERFVAASKGAARTWVVG